MIEDVVPSSSNMVDAVLGLRSRSPLHRAVPVLPLELGQTMPVGEHGNKDDIIVGYDNGQVAMGGDNDHDSC